LWIWQSSTPAAWPAHCSLFRRNDCSKLEMADYACKPASLSY
jgi:hypothetical protein